ncbi:high mobility group box domain-containing protein, partial [Blyttiomyces helicus]
QDPHAPKKALSPYLIFSQEMRPTIKEQNPDATFGQLGKLLGAAWQELNDKDKAVYNQKSEADKARYEREMSTY